MADKYEKDERVIKLAFDISGGLGRQKKGAILRNLSPSAFIGLRAAGHEVLNGDDGQPKVGADEAAVTAPPAPTK